MGLLIGILLSIFLVTQIHFSHKLKLKKINKKSAILRLTSLLFLCGFFYLFFCQVLSQMRELQIIEEVTIIRPEVAPRVSVTS